MYAKLHRTAIRVTLGLAALGGVSVVNAGYALPADPAGFTRSGSWGAGPGYAAGANDSTFGRVIHQQNGLKVQVSGRAVTMPVSYRFAQNAPRIAASVIFAHPGLRTAVGIASWLGVAGVVWNAVDNFWEHKSSVDDIVPGGDRWQGPKGEWYDSFNGGLYAAGNAHIQARNAIADGYEYEFVGVVGNYQYRFKWRPSGSSAPWQDGIGSTGWEVNVCPAGSTKTPAGCVMPGVTTVKINTPEELARRLNPDNQPGWPMPDTVPQELPPNTPLPVEPNPKINPEPGENPQHRPMFVPTGDPISNPNYDPNVAPGPNNRPWIQPGVRLNPSPTINDPWRIDVQPVDRPKEDGNPLPGPESETNSDTGQHDKPKPEERPGLCDEYPDILACQKPELDTPDDEIPKTTKDVSYSPDNLFGGGSCPANKTMNIAGQQVTVWDWDSSCGYIQNYMRPVILVLCAFAAFVIVSGGTRQ